MIIGNMRMSACFRVVVLSATPYRSGFPDQWTYGILFSLMSQTLGLVLPLL